jgi:primosomal replication protein N
VTTANRVELSGVLIEREALRYTPAGIAMLNARLGHASEALEAGLPRQLDFEIAVRFAGSIATRADRLALGAPVVVSGFLAPRRRQSKSLVLHVTDFASANRTDIQTST